MLMLLAVGLTLAFGVMQMANLGHGHVFMAGSYTVYVLYALGGWPFWGQWQQPWGYVPPSV